MHFKSKLQLYQINRHVFQDEFLEKNWITALSTNKQQQLSASSAANKNMKELFDRKIS